MIISHQTPPESDNTLQGTSRVLENDMSLYQQYRKQTIEVLSVMTWSKCAWRTHKGMEEDRHSWRVLCVYTVPSSSQHTSFNNKGTSVKYQWLDGVYELIPLKTSFWSEKQIEHRREWQDEVFTYSVTTTVFVQYTIYRLLSRHSCIF